MWSLYKRKEESEGIFDFSGEMLEPLKFSNGKTQQDVVKEVLEEIEKGNNTIFIKGVCGTGKSAIALNIANNFEKSAIVVPIKSLQKQYEKDYTNEKFLLRKSGKKLKISIIKGRNNFTCPFLGESCDDPFLPCTIEIRESNSQKIYDYLSKNKKVNIENFAEISDIKRVNIASCCPFWSPILPSDANLKILDNYKKKEYEAVCDRKFAIFKRKSGCEYYDQYESYSDSDVIIFNSKKYLLETLMLRKPKTGIDIIDECDEFLDSFTNERKISLNKLQKALNNLNVDKSLKEELREISFLLNSFVLNPKPLEIEKVKKSPLIKIFEKILSNPYLAEESELNYYNSVYETLKNFEDLLDETYVSIEIIKKENAQKNIFEERQKNDDIIVTLVSTNIEKQVSDLLEKTENLVMMSGTLHSPSVLRDIFGLKKFKIIEAETKNPGKVNKIKIGIEKNCNFSNFSSGSITREQYLKILDACISRAKPPTLVHVSAFKDLPSNYEKEKLKLERLITQEEFEKLQNKSGTEIERFKQKEIDILFTTKCSRGIDFAGDKCNSIVITRFPYPNVQDLFWKVLRKEKPDKFMEVYMDKARRELIQKVYRGVRFKGDKVDLLSPDTRVLSVNFE